MKLNLKNPIVFFDLETTGTNINTDRIVEICYLKVYPNGNEETKTMRINPEMHIPEASSAVHGIYDADVADCPTFKEVAKNIARDIEGCDLAGFNSNRFDIPVLAEEFLRAGVDIDLSRRKFVDVQVIFHKLEQRTLSAAYKFYCGKNLEDAHTAAADTQATYEVLMAQLDRYPELQNDIAFLAASGGLLVQPFRQQKFFVYGQRAALIAADQLALLGLVRVLDIASVVVQASPDRFSFILPHGNQPCCCQCHHPLTKRKCRTMAAYRFYNSAIQPLNHSTASTMTVPAVMSRKQPNSASSRIKNCSHSRQYSV